MSIRSSFKATLFVCLATLSATSLADINSFLAGMVYSGTGPFDANDASATDNDVRTHDDVAYRAAFSLTPSDTGAVIKYEIGSFTLPSTLVSGVAQPTKVAYFDPLKLPTGSSGCQNISQNPVADPAPLGTSGVTADGQTVYCSLPSPIGGITLDIPLSIMGNVPNGTTLQPPTITFSSDNNPTTNTPTVANDGSSTFGMETITLTSSPQWDLTKESIRGGLFIPRSGPSGEDGFVLGFNIGIHATGSRKGIEALHTAYFTENYDDPEFPNAQLVNWNIDSPGYSTVLNTDPSACAGWQTVQRALGNFLDNGHFFPRDRNTGLSTNYDIPNGGTCAAQSINNTSHTATIDLIDVDWSLSQYPTKKGSNPTGVSLINTTNLDDPSNEWWVGSKSLLIWVPVGDVPTDGVTRFLTNEAYLFGTSITGQENVEPVITTADNTENSGVRNTVAGSMSKRHTPFISNNPLGLDLSVRDPNVTGDAHVNQVSPGQVFESRVATYNTGTTSFGAGMFCDRIDNSRTTYFNRTPVVASYRAIGTAVLDPDTGVITRALSGNISDIENLNFQLGVGGTGASNGGWDSYSGTTSEYFFPATSGSSNADSGCGDSDAIWFDSIVALEGAGYTLQQVNRVRGIYDSFTASARYLHYIPLQARETYAYSGTDNVTGAFSANDSTLNSITTNVAIWQRGSGLADAEQSGATLIFNNELIKISKSSPTHPNGSLVSPGSQVSYNLQVNAATSGTAHNTDITVWDVLPTNLSYNANSSQLGGVAIADPVCAASGLPAETFPLGTVPAGHTACKWVLPNQAVTKTSTGHASANLPILSFAATVSVTAQTTDQLLNTSFADSAENSTYRAFYDGEGKGFACSGSQNCSFSNWFLTVSANAGIVLNKSVDQTLVAADLGFNYTLNYGVIGNSLQSVRLLEILPYSGDNRGSNFSGTLTLTGQVTLDAADATATVLYTKNAGANINVAPYDSGHDLTNSSSNTATTTNWCTASQFGAPNCPANVSEATALMILPFAGAPQPCGSLGTLPCLSPGTLYNISFGVIAAGNQPNEVYNNNFIGDSPGLLARAPGSNLVSTEVIVPDLVITKSVLPTVVDAGETATYVITPKNNTASGVGPITNTPGTVITLTDNLPSQIIITSAADVDGGANWDCSASVAPSTISCVYDNSGLPIGVGGAIGNPITFDAIAGTLADTTTVTNTASIEMTGQTETSTNNTGSATLTIRARPSSPDIPFAVCTTPNLSNIVPDGIPDLTFPRGYFAASYYEGANQIIGSAAMTGDVNGTGVLGIPLFRGEAFWGPGETPISSASNGTFNAAGTWSSTETPTSSNLPHPSYIGSTWTSNGNPYYQIDFRRTIDVTGTLSIGGLPNNYVDDSVEIFINGTRVYAAFSGGSDPLPSATNKGEVSVTAGDEVLIRVVNLGSTGGYNLSFNTTGYDCSDAPSSYNNASHLNVGDVYLGSTIDSEVNNIASAAANGDGVDDDSVTTIPSLSAQAINYQITVNTTNNSLVAARLVGWIDFDGNGTFDANEAAATVVPAATGNGNVTLNWANIPSDTVSGNTFMRLRLTTDTLNVSEAVGSKSNGEVEDYPITIDAAGATVSGRVYIDANSNTVEDIGENGISNTVVVLYDSLDNSCRSVTTNGNGEYSFTDILDGGYELYQAHGETTPIPQSCNATLANNPTGYQSTTDDILSFLVMGVNVTDQDFGEVAGTNSPTSGNTGTGIFFAPNHQSEILPGNVVFYAHKLRSEADGSVRFTSNGSNNTAAGWSHLIYRDSDCNGKLDGNEASTPIERINFGISAGSELCIIDKVYAPSNVPPQDSYRVDTTATFNYTNTSLAQAVLKVTDVTTAGQTASTTVGESRLVLRKTVENLTQLTAEAESSNQAKPGDRLKYRIYYRNTGTGPITDLKVNDSVPAFTGFLAGSHTCDVTPTGMSCTPTISLDALNWVFTGSLIGGAAGNVSYEVVVDN